MSTITRESSLKISLLSFIAAILVICVHVPSTEVLGISFLVEDFIGTNIASVAVPFFFSVSAFFLGRKINDLEGWRFALGKRVWTLLIPYILWCVFYTFQQNFNSLVANAVGRQLLTRHIDFDLVRMFGLDMTINPPLPLWFIRALILYVLAFPLYYWVVRKNGLVMIVCVISLFVLECTKHLIEPVGLHTLFAFTLAPKNILCFLLGIWMSKHCVIVRKKVGGILLCVGVVIFFGLSLGRVLAINFPMVVRTAASLIATIGVLAGTWTLCPAIELPQCLKGQSFAIYLLHALFIPYAGLIAQMFPLLTSWPWFFINVIVIAASSVVLSCMLRRWMPRFSRLIFGGR